MNNNFDSAKKSSWFSYTKGIRQPATFRSALSTGWGGGNRRIKGIQQQQLAKTTSRSNFSRDSAGAGGAIKNIRHSPHWKSPLFKKDIAFVQTNWQKEISDKPPTLNLGLPYSKSAERFQPSLKQQLRGFKGSKHKKPPSTKNMASKPPLVGSLSKVRI